MRWHCAGSSLLMVVASALASQEATAVPGECLPTEEYRLENGLTVLLQEDHSLPVVAVAASVHVGFRNDPAGHAGLAHYLEHLLFLGPKPEEGVLRRYQKMGATSVNGHTTSDVTEYYGVVPANQLERALWLEARRFAIGVSEVSEERALTEAEVVRREFALRKRGSWRIAGEAAYKALFSEAHPYHDLESSEETLEGLTLAKARWFHEQMYSMDRTQLALVGDFDSGRAKELISKYWSNLRGNAPNPPAAVASRVDLDHTLEPPAQACRYLKEGHNPPPREMVVRVPYKAPTFELMWRVPPEVDVEELERVLDLWAKDTIQLTVDLELASDGGTYSRRQELANFLSLGFSVPEGKDWKNVEKVVWHEYSTFAKQLKEEDFSSYQQQLELEDALSRPAFLGRALSLTGPRCAPTKCEAYRSLSKARVDELLGLFAPERALRIHSQFDFGTVRSGPVAEVAK